MKSASIFSLFVAVLAAFSFTSCNKCKGCYLIEEVDGVRNEFYQGEYCGDEIREQEKKEFVPISGETFIECR